MPEAAVDELAAAVVDGSAIDWPSAERRLTTPEARALAAELKALSALSLAPGNEAARTGQPVASAIWLELIRWIAIGETVIGLAGLALAFAGTPHLDRRLILMTAILTFAGAAVFLDLHARDRRGRLLAGVFWTIAAAFGASGILVFAARPWSATTAALLLAIRPDAFLPAFLWQFAREFPAVNRFSAVDRLGTAAASASLWLATALFAANLLPAIYSGAGEWVDGVRCFPGPGVWFWNIVFSTAMLAILMILWRARSADVEENTRARIFLYGIAIAISPVATVVIAEGTLPAVAALSATPQGKFWGGVLIYPPLLALPVLTAYAIGAGDVLHIRVSVQQGLRYLLAKWLMAAGIAGAAAGLLLYAYRHRELSIATIFESRAARGLLVLNVAAVLVLACRTRLLRALDRWSTPGQYDASGMLATLGDRMRNSRTPLEIAETLAAGAETMLQTSTEVLLLRRDALCPVRPDMPKPPADSLIPVLAAGAHGPFVVEERHPQSYYALLSAEDRIWIDGQRVALVVPVSPGRGKSGPQALVCVRHRRTTQPFSTSDLRFLGAAAASAGLACDALRTEDDFSGAPGSEDRQELAFECAACGAVSAWPIPSDTCACGGDWKQAALPKDLMGRFSLDRFSGAGGMGTVYLGTDRILGRAVALKTLTRLSAPAARRLIAEARTMASLSHAQVGVLYATEMWRGTPVLVLEYLAGGTLADRIRRGPMPLDRALLLVLELSVALDHVHRSGVFHGDIKPSNIGFTAAGVPKFLDFGLARAVGDAQSPETGQLAGTPAYFSPEVIRGAAPGPALDLWSLGIVLCEAVTGRHPFLARFTGASRGTPDLSEPDVDPGLPVPVRQWILRALATDPRTRPATAAIFWTGLSDVRQRVAEVPPRTTETARGTNHV